MFTYIPNGEEESGGEITEIRAVEKVRGADHENNRPGHLFQEH